MSKEQVLLWLNDKILEQGYTPEVGFEHKDMWVTNPYIDGRTRINSPSAHYGNAYCNSLFVKDVNAGLRIAMRQYDQLCAS